jgi:hypothetical protein
MFSFFVSKKKNKCLLQQFKEGLHALRLPLQPFLPFGFFAFGGLSPSFDRGVPYPYQPCHV